jgi:hypothetical protein
MSTTLPCTSPGLVVSTPSNKSAVTAAGSHTPELCSMPARPSISVDIARTPKQPVERKDISGSGVQVSVV